MKKYSWNLGVPRMWLPKKLLLIMKLTTFILIIALAQVSAKGFGQRVSLDETNAPLEKVLETIRKQSGVGFIYDVKDLKDQKVSIKISDVTVEDAVRDLLKDLPLSYKIVKNNIVLTRKTPSFLERLADRWASIDVHGRVVDQEGKPLQGATVKVKSTGKSAISNAKGEIYLEKIEADAILVISFIGYLSKEIVAAKDLGIVMLELSDSKLDEIQVIAYGQTSKRLSTGNISSVKAKDIETQPVNNPLLALTGRVPGLFITQSNGLPGSGVTVRIQGRNSIGKGNDPFYVIDGVPYVSQVLPTVGIVLGSSGGEYQGARVGQGNPLNFINPADIESIEVLKDADATAIYGSRAANGAILITTKKASTGQTAVNVTFQTGVGDVYKKMKLLNTQQYLEMRREAYKNDGLPVPTSDLPANQKNSSNYDFTVWDTNRYTDWQKELIGGNAKYTDLQASISGGNQLTTFRINGGYHRETTVFPGNFSDVKGSLGVSINHSSTNQKFKLDFSGNYLQDNNQLPNQDLTSNALITVPNAPALYTPNGQLNWERILKGTDSVSTWTNPLSYLKAIYQNETNNLVGNLSLSYRIISSLEAKISLGYTNTSTSEIIPFPSTIYAPERRSTLQRATLFGNGRTKTWIVEPQLNYHIQFHKSSIGVLVGSTIQENMNNLQQLYASGFNSDLVLKDINAASSVSVGQTLISNYKYAALFGRITYNLSNKYIVNLTARRDGSSRFGDNNRFHNFGAIGAAWLFSEESFVKDNLSVLSFGKLRASYGTSGNDQIGDYQFLSLYEPVSYGNQYQGVTGLRSKGLTNPYIQWELTKKLQGGIDLGFIKDRVLVNANYYYNTSANQLLFYSLPFATGFTGIYRNFPATVVNSGWEFSLNTINIQKKEFSWSTSFNLTIPQNKLKNFPDLASSTYANQLVIGKPLSIVKQFEFAGVNAETGEYQYLGADGAVTSSPKDIIDQIIILNPDPNWYGGLQNSLSYKGFMLDVFFQFVEREVNNNYTLELTNSVGRGTANQTVSVLNRWQKPGDQAEVQKFSSLPNFSISPTASNADNTDASYLRLKNVSFSWSLPSSWLKTVHIAKGRVFVQGQNLLTFTKYKGLDPENLTISSLPPLRVWTMGVQVTL